MYGDSRSSYKLIVTKAYNEMLNVQNKKDIVAYVYSFTTEH